MTAPDSVLLIKANSSISNATAARLGATCRERVTFFDSSLSFVFFFCVSLSFHTATHRQVLALLQRSYVYVFLILALHGTVVFSAAPAGGVRGVGMGSGSCGPLRVPLCLRHHVALCHASFTWARSDEGKLNKHKLCVLRVGFAVLGQKWPSCSRSRSRWINELGQNDFLLPKGSDMGHGGQQGQLCVCGYYLLGDWRSCSWVSCSRLRTWTWTKMYLNQSAFSLWNPWLIV